MTGSFVLQGPSFRRAFEFNINSLHPLIMRGFLAWCVDDVLDAIGEGFQTSKSQEQTFWTVTFGEAGVVTVALND